MTTTIATHRQQNTAVEREPAIANTKWPPSPWRPSFQVQQNISAAATTTTMAMAIMTRRQQHSSGSQTGNQHGVANGLDRGRNDVVVDVVNMPPCDALVFQVLLLKATPR